MKSFFLKHKKKLIVGVVAIILIMLVTGGKGNGDEGVSLYTVERGTVADTLVLSGEARPIEGADMAFVTGGLVAQVYKEAGDPVYVGEKIIELDNAALWADRADAAAALDIVRAEGKVSNAELNQAVASARAKFLSDGLAAYSRDLDNDNQPPTVSGSYRGTSEGQYRIEINPSGGASRVKIRYTGLESGEAEINFYKPVALGTKGLYLSFTKEDTSVSDVWMIDIPNLESEFYIDNLNAYEDALASRDAAESSNISAEITQARIKQAEARLASIDANINERIIRAPFAGTVSKVDIKKGELATAGQIVTGVIGGGAYEVVVEVPEVDLVDLVPGLPVSITLDAYGAEAPFAGTLVSIDPAETEVDGVSVYRANVSFNAVDSRIRSGMTADVAIEKRRVEGVLRVPKRFIDTDDTGQFVLVRTEDADNKAYVTTGLEGGDGFVEIISGLSGGEIVVGEF